MGDPTLREKIHRKRTELKKLLNYLQWLCTKSHCLSLVPATPPELASRRGYASQIWASTLDTNHPAITPSYFDPRS